MSTFKKIPELGWLKELTDLLGTTELELTSHLYRERMQDLYRYLIWSQRFRLTTMQTDEGRVANGMMTKYYRRLFPMTLSQSMTDYEKKFIAESEALRKKMLRDAKKAKLNANQVNDVFQRERSKRLRRLDQHRHYHGD
jgi:hypothetical protein